MPASSPPLFDLQTLRARHPRFFHAIGWARRAADLLAALACLYAAAFHTPPGGIARALVSRLLHRPFHWRPLLAYYGGGTEAAGVPDALPAVPTRMLSPEEAMGYGARCAADQLAASDRAKLFARAAPEGVSSAMLADPRHATASYGALVARLSRRYGSDDLAMLDLFCGEDAAHYAKEIAGSGEQLPELARSLPPSLCPRGVALAGQALALGTAAGLGWPVPAKTRVMSPFGEREHPTLGGVRMHKGVDLGVPQGTPIEAAGAGTVKRASEDAINGRAVVIDHGHGVTSAYLHNQLLLVESGEKVRRAQVISRSGSTGRSTGPHLHYQLEISGVAVDPLLFRRVE